MLINIPESLYISIVEYCDFNNHSNYEEEIIRLLKIGFNVDKFGATPFSKFNVNKHTEEDTLSNKETQKEVIVKIEDEVKSEIQPEVKEVEVTPIETQKPKVTKRKIKITKT